MKEKTIQLYNFEELNAEAKIKALDDHNEHNDYDFLSENLSEYLVQLLEENRIKGDAKLFYSLSNCQGDGVCFTGDFEFQGINFNVEHNNGHYYHNNSTNITAEKDENDDGDELRADVIEVLTQDAEENFKEVYKEICDAIEKTGYAQIEHEQSEECFKETCDANEYTFRASGEMENF